MPALLPEAPLVHGLASSSRAVHLLLLHLSRQLPPRPDSGSHRPRTALFWALPRQIPGSQL